MYGVFFLKKSRVYTLVFLKALFSITRSFTAAALSLSGSLLSVSVMLAIIYFNADASYSFLSICGAMAHNIGQYLVAMVILSWSKQVFFAYLPVLLISGVVMGFATSIILKAVLPALKKLGLGGAFKQ